MAWTLPAQAGADGVPCGAVLTADTTLTADVGPCDSGPAGAAILLGADNITLNLNGHVVFGELTKAGDGVGIGIIGRNGVKVIGGGTVQYFDAGMVMQAGGNNQVIGVTLTTNQGTFDTNFGDGIVLDQTHHNIIRGNVAQSNGPYDGIGVLGALSANNQILNNRVVDNNTSFQDDGIRLEPGTHHNTVTGNSVSGSSLDGIVSFNNSADNVVTNNSVFRNVRDGIGVGRNARRVRVQGNTSNLNGRYGIGTSGLDGQMLRNSARRNGALDLIDTNVACDNNTWTGNSFGTASPVTCIH